MTTQTISPPQPFTFEAAHIRTVDGDTVHERIEVGFGLEKPDVDIRLRGINAPELHGPDHDAAEKAKAYVENALSNATLIRVQTYAHDDFGRWIGTIWYQADNGWHLLNQELLDRGLATPYMGPVDPTAPDEIGSTQ